MRYTANIHDLPLPATDERLLQGNVAFMPDYLARVLDECPSVSGIALIRSHLGPGWQDMSGDDVVAERERLAGSWRAAAGCPLSVSPGVLQYLERSVLAPRRSP